MDSIDLARLCIAVPALIVLLRWAANRWRYRRVPGPFAPPLLGNIVAIKRAGGLHTYTDYCRRRYGRVFKIYLGSKMFLICADHERSRKVLYKLTNHRVPPQLTADSKLADSNFFSQGLFSARDDLWRSLRAAWQPAFSSTSLEGYTGLMDACATKLCGVLEGAAAEGRVVDMHREIGKMTMGVVGTCAYGFDFHTLDGAHGSTDGRALVEASERVFRSGMLSGSLWAVNLLFFPDATRLVQWLAARMPDQALKDLTEARRTIINVSRSLIQRFHSVKEAAAAASRPCPEAQAAPAPALALGEGAPDTKKRAVGIAPGSFLSLLLENSRRTFDDETAVAQSNTFILAGYETTASTLAYTLWAISAYPRVQERALAEVDAFGRDRPVTYADLAAGNFPYLEATMKEAMRLYPAAIMTHREVSKPEGFELLPGVVVPQNETIFTAIYCQHRDEAVWPAAEEFLPERFMPEGAALAPRLPLEVAFTPFGAGARLCIGYRFAQQEALIALVRLFQRFTFALEPGMVPLRTAHFITLSPQDGVRCRVVPRS